MREVLVYMPMYDKWKKTGDMETARDNHAVTRIERSAVEQFYNYIDWGYDNKLDVLSSLFPLSRSHMFRRGSVVRIQRSQFNFES